MPTFRHILPLIGRITSKDPKAYRYLYESVQAFPDGEAFFEHIIPNWLQIESMQSLNIRRLFHLYRHQIVSG